MPLFLTPGDPSGIGPEITLQALKQFRGRTPVVCIGAPEPPQRLGAQLCLVSEARIREGLPRKRAQEIYWLPAPAAPSGALALVPQKQRLFASEGFQAGWSIEVAVRLILGGHGRALVTGPINKARLQLGGFPYPGHTEMLAALSRGHPQVTMMLANSKLRVSLVTTHCSLGEVPGRLNSRGIVRAGLQTAHALQRWWKISRPRIALCALNPHAGEGGLFGDEEGRVVGPAIETLRKTLGKTAEILGPLPADTLFANHLLARRSKRYDAVVCMYHDQGLIPVKLIDFYRTVNVTLGLPFIRTSVDHGVAYDLVGTGQARADSLLAALSLAEKLSRQALKR